MQRDMMKSKIHGATVTQCNLGYVGSLTEVFDGEVTGWRGAFPRRGGTFEGRFD